MKEIVFTGIGSRETPEEVLEIIAKIAKIFSKKGFILRSGRAKGSDITFENNFEGKKEIYLPWKGFEGSDSPLYNHPTLAEEIAFKFHPNLYGCSQGVIKLMTRNSCQVLGKDCKTPCDFIVCYCAVDKNGKWIGGTGQALRIASDPKYNIPIFNLFFKEDLEKLKIFVKELESKNCE